MPRTASLSTACLNIPTRPALASRSAISSKSTSSLPNYPLPMLETSPAIPMPDTGFQSNGPPPTLVGLGIGIGSTDTPLPYSSNQTQKRTAITSSRYLRQGSSFDYEKSMAVMKIDASPVSLSEPIALAASSPSFGELSFESEFNSLYDLDVQYPSSRSLSAPSPQSSVNYSYSPAAVSSSWSLDSVFTSTLTSPENTLPSSSSEIRLLPASWSSSSKSSLLSSPIVVKPEWASHFLRTPDMSAPLVDINMFQASASSQSSSSSMSIDPAYLTAPFDFPSESLPSNTKGHIYDEDVFKSTGFGPNGFTRSLLRLTSPVKLEMDDGGYAVAPVAPDCMTLPSALPEVTVRPRILKRKSSTQDDILKVEEHADSFVPGTPILDAHRGIDQEELEAKASRYQQRNPGMQDFNRHWLASFSGKLSDQGEMIKDFRCYVVGCTQVNKRRDHMIIHVGSHLDQRPFKCEHCASTFLRKNELKRHTSNHDTSRPFGCPYCPSTFRRQDLLARHLKKLHATQGDDENKENVRPRKKVKAL